MRKAFALTAIAIAAAVACKSPAEPAASDASFTPAVSDAAGSAPSASAAPAAPDASAASSEDAPGKYPAVDRFCAGSYGADLEIARTRCATVDYLIQQNFTRVATRLCRHDLELLQDRGAARLDEKSADACVAMLKGAPQPDVKLHEGETFFLRPPCDKIVIGTRREGESCRFPPECKDGLQCLGYKVGVDGTCKKPAAVGGECSPQAYGSILSELAIAGRHPACVKGAFCTDMGTCAARAKAGDACAAHKQCDAGLWCVAGKCSKAPFATSGGACAKTADCAFGLFCDRGKCTSKRSAGEPCTDDQCKGWCDVPPKEKAGTCRASCGSG